jgi:REP element-mobilizing transposase RayT
MRFHPERHHRRSIRLKGYDYRQAGAYFVTICTQDRAFLFGQVVHDEMRLNDAGKMVYDVWNDLPAFYPGVQTDAFIVMPNHIHGIIILVGADPRVCPNADPRVCPAQPSVGVGPRAYPGSDPRAYPDSGPRACPGQPQELGQPQGVAPTLGLPDVVHRFKTMTTKRYADGVKRLGWEPFRGRLWQRNYYEHIIRNEESLNRIREYILTNPMRWALDRENPHRVGVDEFDTWLNSVGKESNAETNARRQPHRQLPL